MPISLKTVREVHVILRRALEGAVRWDYIHTNPAHRANAPSATAAKNQRKNGIQTWTSAQVHEFTELYAENVTWLQQLQDAGVPRELVVVERTYRGFEGVEPRAEVSRDLLRSRISALRTALSDGP